MHLAQDSILRIGHESGGSELGVDDGPHRLPSAVAVHPRPDQLRGEGRELWAGGVADRVVDPARRPRQQRMGAAGMVAEPPPGQDGDVLHQAAAVVGAGVSPAVEQRESVRYRPV